MVLKFEDLKVLQAAELVADEIWRKVVRWDQFARNVVGKQLARAADSVGANIAEAYGRFHFGEKLQFLYYARGSLFEAKYWLNRSLERNLLTSEEVSNYATQMTDLARQLNAFASELKAQRRKRQGRSRTIREDTPEYIADWIDESPMPLFTVEEIEWMQSIPNT
ncbi:MAG: four helix bundle protein [Anaerolineales bacterium]|nr:four helix bundle protein [Chloroflexota bacterium]MBL6982792.1 four helix bundle protein [Anaerolineales bacterium]